MLVVQHVVWLLLWDGHVPWPSQVSQMNVISCFSAECLPSLGDSSVASLLLDVDAANPLLTGIKTEREIHQILDWQAYACAMIAYLFSEYLTSSCNRNNPGYWWTWVFHAGCPYQPLCRWLVGSAPLQLVQPCHRWRVQPEPLVPGWLAPPPGKSSLIGLSESIWVEVLNAVLCTLGHVLV